MQNKFVNLQRLDDFKELIKEFSDIVLLKGLDLALNYYNDLGVREFEDIDIIIKPNMLKNVDEYLVSHGYTKYIRRDKLNSFEYCRNITKFHIHTRLENAVYPQPHFKKLDKNFRDYLKISYIDGLRYMRLEKNFNFLYILFHGLKHNFDKSIRLLDIVEMIKVVQWQDVYTLSKKFDCYRLLIMTLQYLFNLDKLDNTTTNFIFDNSGVKNHSGMDLLFYFYINPVKSIFYLPLLSKSCISRIYNMLF